MSKKQPWEEREDAKKKREEEKSSTLPDLEVRLFTELLAQAQKQTSTLERIEGELGNIVELNRSAMALANEMYAYAKAGKVIST